MTKFLNNADVTGYISQTLVTSSLLKTDSSGKLVAAVAGTDYNAPNVSAVAGTLIREIRNATGATLTKGTVVYISGATGNKPTVSKALATGDSTSAQTFGLCQTDIANNSNGYVVCVGDITGLDTSAFTEGVQLYLSSTTAGTYTTTKQVAPAHLVYVGVVTRSHPTQGQIEVKIQNGYELDEIHDVSIVSKTNNDFLVYESATTLWKNKSLSTVLGYTPANPALCVPYYGATNNVDLGTWALTAGVVYSANQMITDARMGFKDQTAGSFATFAGYTYLSSSATYFAFARSSTERYQFMFNGGVYSYTLPSANGTLALTSDIPTLSGLGGVPTSRTLTINGTAYDLSANRSWTIAPGTSARTETIFTATSGQTTFTISGGYTAGLVDVYVNGVKLLPADFTATNGSTVVLATGAVLNDAVTIINYTAMITALPTSRDVFDYTATAGQTAFTVSGGYAVGLLDVFVNGVKLTSSEYTATNGTSFTLTVASILSDQVQAIRYNASTTGISGSGTANYIPKFTTSGTIGNSAITDDGTTVTLVSRALSGTSATFSSTITSSRNDAGNISLTLQNSYINQGNLINFTHNSGGTTTNGYIGHGGDSTGNFVIINNGITALSMARATGAATFSSSVAANSTNGISGTFKSSEFFGSIDLENTGGTATGKWNVQAVSGAQIGGTAGSSFGIYSYGASAYRMFITSAGNVGIGTTSPITAGGSYVGLNISGATGSSLVLTSGSSHTYLYAVNAGNDFAIENAGAQIFRAGSSERMRITSGGNVGIGTTTSDWNTLTALQIRNVSFAAYTSGTTHVLYAGSNFYYGGSGGGDKYITDGAASLYTQAAGEHKWFSAGVNSSGAGASMTVNERMRITSGGDVCIASTAPVSNRRELRIGGNAAGSRISMGLNGTNYSALVTDSGGNVYLANEFNDSAIRLLMINFNNGVYLSQSATSWTSNSDERMKTDLVAIENATEKVASLRSVIGRYKTDDDSKRRPFLIAQDVYSVLPEAVDIDQKTGMMGIQYTEVIPLLVASIKELKAELDTLKKA